MPGTTTVTKVKVRRGTELQRRTVVFDSGELAYCIDSDSRRLFVGDGITYGGISVGMRFYSGNRAANPNAFSRAQVGDIVYDTSQKALFVLSGINVFGFPDFSNLNAYQNISTQVDNGTIEYNNDRQLSLKIDSVSAIHIHSSAFDLEGGFLREVSNGTFKINIDNASIALNGLNQLFVDPRYVRWELLPTAYPGPGTNKMWIDTVNGNVVRIAV